MRKIGVVGGALVLVALGIGVAASRASTREVGGAPSLEETRLGAAPESVPVEYTPADDAAGGGGRVVAMIGVAEPTSRSSVAGISGIAARDLQAPFLEMLGEDEPPPALKGEYALRDTGDDTSRNGSRSSWLAYGAGLLVAGTGVGLLQSHGFHAMPVEYAPLEHGPGALGPAFMPRGSDPVSRPGNRGEGAGSVGAGAGTAPWVPGGTTRDPRVIAPGGGTEHSQPTTVPVNGPGAPAGRDRVSGTPGGSATDLPRSGGTGWDAGERPGTTPVIVGEVGGDPAAGQVGGIERGSGSDSEQIPVAATVTPEPLSISLLGTGLAGVVGLRHRRKRQGA